MNYSNRRQFLKSTAALAAGSAVLRAAAATVSPAASILTGLAPTRLNQFNYADVRLLDGPMLVQFQQNIALFLSLPDDNLLKPFRQLAGQPAPGEDMGGWYSPSSDFDPPKNMTGYIPGHNFGQFMSGLSRAHAVTGDPAIQRKVHGLVAGFAPTVSTKFYDGYCIPAYTFDKTNCGLIDAHQFAAAPSALAVLDHATDAVLPWLPEKALNRDEMMARPHKNIAFTWDEPYTLPENFYLGYQRGAGARYRKLAQRYLADDTYFNALAEGHNVLPGLHAYSHVNALCSAMQCYLTDNSSKHLEAARNGFRFVLEQSFATGGWGPDEGFRKPGTDELASTLTSSHNSFETPCGAYGHFKISRYLIRATGDSTYGDSMEAILYNTILGARPIRSDGVSFYYSDYNNNAHKANYEQKWPCCAGTFPQLTADYGISSYFHSPAGIFVNLYVPSRVSWRQGSARVSLTQQTNYPALGDTALHLKLDHSQRFAIALRIPAWASKQTSVSVNGKSIPDSLQPGTWAHIEREWHDGDTVELSLDMPLRLVPLDPKHPSLVALVYGPVALFALNPEAAQAPSLTRTQLLQAVRVGSTSSQWPDWQVDTGIAKVNFKAFPAITDESYRLYHETDETV